MSLLVSKIRIDLDVNLVKGLGQFEFQIAILGWFKEISETRSDRNKVTI